MNRTLWLIGTVVTLPLLSALADTPVDVPAGVNYKAADPALNDKVKADLLAALAGGADSTEKFFGKACICAPGYWKTLKGRSDVKFTATIPSKFNIPLKDHTLTLSGVAVKESSDFKLLATQFAKDAGTAPTIRKIAKNELSMLWSIVPFDLQEPVFIVETKDSRFVLLLSLDNETKQYQISWLDDLNGYSGE